MALKLKEVKELDTQTGKHLNPGNSVQFSRHSAGLCEWLQERLALPLFSVLKNTEVFLTWMVLCRAWTIIINFFLNYTKVRRSTP